MFAISLCICTHICTRVHACLYLYVSARVYMSCVCAGIRSDASVAIRTDEVTAVLLGSCRGCTRTYV